MNITPMVIVAMFLGGFIGRILGYNYLVDYLGWPGICGWFSIPIGAFLAWILVEVEAIIPAFRRAREDSKEPSSFKFLRGKIIALVDYVVSDFRTFGKNWRWKTVYATLVGMMWSSWIIGYFFYCTKLVVEKSELVSASAAFAMFFLMCFCAIGLFFEVKGWDKKTYDITTRVCKDEELNKIRATSMGYKLLVFNPVSMPVLFFLVLIPYWGFLALRYIFTRVYKITTKTIMILNSSNRMVAMMGAAIGLSISQVAGYNPIICGLLCVLSGLSERWIYLRVTKILARRRRRLA